jgi:hypothetical protein
LDGNIQYQANTGGSRQDQEILSALNLGGQDNKHWLLYIKKPFMHVLQTDELALIHLEQFSTKQNSLGIHELLDLFIVSVAKHELTHSPSLSNNPSLHCPHL